MKLKCEKCQREATVHLTEIQDGQKIEKHLCEECAATEGITIKSHVPLSQVLQELMLQSAAGKELSKLRCAVCGLSFMEFRQQGLLGCPNDYVAFETALAPLLERAHEGSSLHVGKVPVNAHENERRSAELLRLRGQLKDAVAHEDYEQAARLRDLITEMEGQ